MQRVLERDEFLRAVDAELGLAPQRIHPADHALVEIEVHAHRVVNAPAALEQARQDVVDVADRKSIVGAVITHRTVGTGATTVPGLAGGITVAHEQDVFGLLATGNQHRHCLGLVEAREVVEIAVRPIVVMDVAVALTLGRRGDDGDGALAHELHELLAAARVFVFAQGHGRSEFSSGGPTVRDQCRAVEVVWAARRSASSS